MTIKTLCVSTLAAAALFSQETKPAAPAPEATPKTVETPAKLDTPASAPAEPKKKGIGARFRERMAKTAERTFDKTAERMENAADKSGAALDKKIDAKTGQVEAKLDGKTTAPAASPAKPASSGTRSQANF